MSISLLIILIVVITWGLLHFFVYGHKAQINRLWKEIFRYAHETAKLKNINDELGSIATSDALHILQIRANRTGKLINALLDYHYADTEDEDEQGYVKDNHYEEKF
ncbi:MAG: hypothetical protein A3G49_01290 [Candidatus Sungbacteria bacterium RIFCSPLOWO2_12_FULL_41_11]|uniref:Uncharacterized protein n=1 Tax=Candidatus Sungbacteria bacterium RIFCSPLOWO2_12_FULL_41_11 TaxID=1802286 RepID=A0A1G2LNS2_9BACT|nr:MAG: hypothetical protein UV01_C0006G0015 [Parcubacteria group bacterium GW2011_GWA2_42_14]OGZ97390.1 MAG: hypothetical protein A3D41_05475 [Candidatus Sungbacteria bacterium RIFCSPHIGHO2_02_FULL_41_12b]OHA13268.1 MAG: hypothetical protein A3G49_01290 [Candidatus Sungbacteria bacterium RIFCSPLOWO2_12_FULL_41_11]